MNIEPSDLVAHLKGKEYVRWPGKARDDNKERDMTKYCEFHSDYGHTTDSCKGLRLEVSELLKRGHLKEFLIDKGKNTICKKNDKRERSSPPPKTIQSGPLHPWRSVNIQWDDESS